MKLLKVRFPASVLTLCLVLTVLLTSSCSKARRVDTSFYFWKTSFAVGKEEARALKTFNSNKLYVRIMDLDWDPERGELVPVSPIDFKEKPSVSMQVIPVVFIVNKALNNLDTSGIKKLSAKIIQFVSAKIGQAGKKGFAEIQVDCDWTKNTRQTYFRLLEELKKELDKEHQQLSVTLRLHQYKNRSLGIPPANKVTLMCYNMGNLRKYGNQNSILELSEMKKYLDGNLPAYPVHMDIALPLFSWTVAFRNTEYIGLSRIGARELRNTTNFKAQEGTLFLAKADLPQYGIRQGDILRHENVTGDDLIKASALLQKLVHSQDSTSIVFYHLNNQLIQNFRHEDLEKVISNFN